MFSHNLLNDHAPLLILSLVMNVTRVPASRRVPAADVAPPLHAIRVADQPA